MHASPFARIPTALVLAVLVATAAAPASAQLRPDKKAVELAQSLKKKRATADAIATQLQRSLRQTVPQVTAVLAAVGFDMQAIGAVHRHTYRMDASKSARATKEALGSDRKALQTAMVAARSASETFVAAQAELNMQQVFLLQQIVREFDSTPEEIFDVMTDAGESLPDIAGHLQGTFGWSPTEVSELFASKNVETAGGAAALQAVGASPMDMIYFVFREAIAGANQSQAYFLERGKMLRQMGGDAAAYVAAMRTAGAEAMGVAVVACALSGLESVSAIGSVGIGVIQAAASLLGGAGYTLAEMAAALDESGVSDSAIGHALSQTGATAGAILDVMTGTLDLTAAAADIALTDVLPATVDYLVAFVEVGGTGNPLGTVMTRLRAAGESAVAIAMGVGGQLGMMGTAQALWDGGYSPAEVGSGLVEGMGATATEAAQIVSGLAGG